MHIHPKLYSVNPHNITQSLISQNPRERMFVVHSPFLIVTFVSLISWILSLMQATKEVHPHPHIAPCVNMLSVTPYSYPSSSSCATCWKLVHAYVTSPGKTKWSGPHQQRWEENDFKFHSVTCYANSLVSHIHVNTTKLRNITCTLVTTSVILWSLECALF